MSENYGSTPLGAQMAMIGELETLFEGRRFWGQGERKALKVFCQDVPIPTDDDDDDDPEAALAPFVVVTRTGTEIPTPESPQVLQMELTICCYDEGKNREGFMDVANIQEAILQHFNRHPYYGNYFTVLWPMASAMQDDDTHPYYWGNVALSVTTQLAPTNKEWEDLL